MEFEKVIHFNPFVRQNEERIASFKKKIYFIIVIV